MLIELRQKIETDSSLLRQTLGALSGANLATKNRSLKRNNPKSDGYFPYSFKGNPLKVILSLEPPHYSPSGMTGRGVTVVGVVL